MDPNNVMMSKDKVVTILNWVTFQLYLSLNTPYCYIVHAITMICLDELDISNQACKNLGATPLCDSASPLAIQLFICT